MIGNKRDPAYFFLALLAVAGLVTALYWPGLSSGLVLDDFPNLERLERIVGGNTRDEFWNFVLMGMSGPTGRPLSLLTFALQAASWPDDPAAFKAVNLALHLLNGVLVYFLAALLLGPMKGSARHAVSLAAATVWLLLPLHVTTVLYVIQRMTLLSGTFVLTGLLAYTWFRIHHCHRRRGAVFGVLLLSASAFLSTISKENGVLIFLYAAVIEIFITSSIGITRAWKTVAWPALGGFLLSGLAVLIFRFDTLVLDTYLIRDFTLFERLMTEPRILLEYIALIFVPFGHAFTLFHDNYPISDLAAAIPWLFSIAALILIAWMARRKLPILTFGILWFFAGHAMESTVIGLELYFEHRNYLPSFGLVLAVLALVHSAVRRLPTNWNARLFALLVGAWASAYAFASAGNVAIWTQPLKQANVLYATNPDSLRARLYLLRTFLSYGRMEKAKRLMQDIRQSHPDAPHPQVFSILARCGTNEIPLPDATALAPLLATSEKMSGVYMVLSNVVDVFDSEVGCKYVELPWLIDLLSSWASQETEPMEVRKALVPLARAEYLAGNLEDAMIHLDIAAEIQDNGDIRLSQTEWLIRHGYLADARYYLELAREATNRSGYLAGDRIHELEQRIEASDREMDSLNQRE